MYSKSILVNMKSPLAFVLLSIIFACGHAVVMETDRDKMCEEFESRPELKSVVKDCFRSNMPQEVLNLYDTCIQRVLGESADEVTLLDAHCGSLSDFLEVSRNIQICMSENMDVLFRHIEAIQTGVSNAMKCGTDYDEANPREKRHAISRVLEVPLLGDV